MYQHHGRVVRRSVVFWTPSKKNIPKHLDGKMLAAFLDSTSNLPVLQLRASLCPTPFMISPRILPNLSSPWSSAFSPMDLTGPEEPLLRISLEALERRRGFFGMSGVDNVCQSTTTWLYKEVNPIMGYRMISTLINHPQLRFIIGYTAIWYDVYHDPKWSMSWGGFS